MVCVTLASEDQICLMSHIETAGEDTEDLETVDNIEKGKDLTDKTYLQRKTEPFKKMKFYQVM